MYQRRLVGREDKTLWAGHPSVVPADMILQIHSMDKGSWMPDQYTNWHCDGTVFKYICFNLKSTLRFCIYRNFYSSWKAFHKILEHFCGNMFPVFCRAFRPQSCWNCLPQTVATKLESLSKMPLYTEAFRLSFTGDKGLSPNCPMPLSLLHQTSQMGRCSQTSAWLIRHQTEPFPQLHIVQQWCGIHHPI